jgi:carboxypeptidase PM20D1
MVRGKGGHSSTPLKHSALGLIAELITRIEANPLPARFMPTVVKLLQTESAESGGFTQFAVKHIGLFGGIVKRILTKTPELNALLRTTFAVTMAHAGDTANVLPQSATVNVNVRLLTGDTTESVARYFKSLAIESYAEMVSFFETFLAGF